MSGNQEFFIEEKEYQERDVIRREKAVHIFPTGGIFYIHANHKFNLQYVLAPTDSSCKTYLPAEVITDVADDTQGENSIPKLEVKFSNKPE